MGQLDFFSQDPPPNRIESLTKLTRDEEDALIRKAQKILALRCRRGRALLNAKDTIAYIQLKIGDRANEVFCAIYLDNKHRVLAFEEHFFGSIASSAVHPRVIVQCALAHNAAAVILAHNHPSGVAEPSVSDKTLTRRLKEALDLVEVQVLDHIVVSPCETVSFAEQGLI